MDALKRQFRPEFINRMDTVIVFRALNRADIRKIVELELGKVQEMLIEQDLTISATDEAFDFMAEEGYDPPEMGARPVRRVVQQMIEEPLSDALLMGQFEAGDHIIAELEEEDGKKNGLSCVKRSASAFSTKNKSPKQNLRRQEANNG